MLFWNNKKENNQQDINIKDVMIIDYLIDGILVFDEKNKLFLINLQGEEFLNVEKDKILGKTIFELDRLIDLGSLVSFSETKINEKEIKIKENLIVKARAIPMLSNGERKGILFILRDITKEKLTEKAKSEFIRLSTHQLWTPASAIKWSLQMLLNGDIGSLNEEQRSLIKKTYDANNREIKLIEDLLNVAKIEMGMYPSDMSLSNIEEIIKSIIDECKEEANKKNILIKFEKSENQFPMVMVDVEKIKLAIKNILDNSIRYSSKGGAVEILLSKNKEIEIQISDNGMGIPKNEQNKVFNKFFRGSNILQIDTEGTGLGLYMSKSIIEAHNGKIWFNSEEGKGTTFFISIPIKEKFGEFITNKFY